MFILAMLFQTANKNLLLGFVPESLGLMLFGVGLIVCAVGLRRIFNRIEEADKEKNPVKAQNSPREI